MKVLSLSDKVIPFIYSPQITTRFDEVDLILGCGDLAYTYLEYVLTALNAPLFFVRGNHDKVVEYGDSSPRSWPQGGVDLHNRVVSHQGCLIAGVEGSLRYRQGPFQYSQNQMWMNVFRLVPNFLLNYISRGRFLDIFISHAPPYRIHDEKDLPHQGIKAFKWMINVFKPKYFFHGHIHVYRPDTTVRTQYEKTLIINTYGYKEMNLEFDR